MHTCDRMSISIHKQMSISSERMFVREILLACEKVHVCERTHGENMAIN